MILSLNVLLQIYGSLGKINLATVENLTKRTFWLFLYEFEIAVYRIL